MKKLFPINHEIDLLIGEDEIHCIINGSIGTWDDTYGEDSDGNRGEAIVDQEIEEWEVVDLNNQPIKDETILKEAEKFYDENLASKDAENAESNHCDN